jgi:hypothetical protein
MGSGLGFEPIGGMVTAMVSLLAYCPKCGRTVSAATLNISDTKDFVTKLQSDQPIKLAHLHGIPDCTWKMTKTQKQDALRMMQELDKPK